MTKIDTVTGSVSSTRPHEPLGDRVRLFRQAWTSLDPESPVGRLCRGSLAAAAAEDPDLAAEVAALQQAEDEAESIFPMAGDRPITFNDLNEAVDQVCARLAEGRLDPAPVPVLQQLQGELIMIATDRQQRARRDGGDHG